MGLFDVKRMLQQQLREVELWHESPPNFSEHPPERQAVFEKKASLQHYMNFQLWHQEDLARDSTASDAQIAQVKRTIDGLNQQRNNLIEALDEWLLHELQAKGIPVAPHASLNSETPGSVIDRLSISALKIYHMREETLRPEAELAHRERCQGRLVVLEEQRADLGQCLAVLIEDLLAGRKVLKIYRQMKMYNDETLNPVLYKRKNPA